MTPTEEANERMLARYRKTVLVELTADGNLSILLDGQHHVNELAKLDEALHRINQALAGAPEEPRMIATGNHRVLTGPGILLQMLAAERMMQEWREGLKREGWAYDGLGRWTHPDKPHMEIWEG